MVRKIIRTHEVVKKNSREDELLKKIIDSLPTEKTLAKLAKKSILEGYSQENKENQTPAENQFKTYLYQVRKYLQLADKADIGDIYPQFIITSNTVITAYILDFYLPRICTAFEIDGPYHAKRLEYDAKRDKYVKKRGIKTIRYKNCEVFEPNFRNQLREDIRKRILEVYPNGLGMRYVKWKEDISNWTYMSHMRERHLRG